jgi:hypothetical protein
VNDINDRIRIVEQQLHSLEAATYALQIQSLVVSNIVGVIVGAWLGSVLFAFFKNTCTNAD